MEAQQLPHVAPSSRRVVPIVRPSPRPGVLQVVLTLGAGGTERLVLEICKALDARFRMAVCALDDPGVWADEVRDRGIEVVALSRRPGFRPSLGYRIAQLARQADCRVVHCHHYSPFVYGRVAAWLDPRLRVVFTEHGRLSDGAASRKRRVANTFFTRGGAPMFAVSGALRESMIAEGFPASRVRVVHNGIDPGVAPMADARTAARAQLALDETTFVAGTVARLDPVKDLGTLIDAFAMFAETRGDTALVIVGEGSERARLERHAAHRGVRDRIRFLGERADVRQFLPAFDVYLNSSTSEGISLTILEAMAAELPVVATGVGGTPEVLTHEHDGLLVPARNAAAIYNALQSLVARPGLRKAMGMAARRTVLKRFTIDRMIEHYARIYCDLAGQAPW